MDILRMTFAWFMKARPEPTDDHFRSQVAVHFEEVSEMIEEITPMDQDTLNALMNAKIAMTHLSDHIKNHPGCVTVLDENRIGFLDAVCDQLVTATGSARMLKMDPAGGLEEVNRSNWSKFVDGEPIFNENGKIIKGPNYSPPDLTPYI